MKTYLDYNATAPLRDEARKAMLSTLSSPHNASSVHGFGREGRSIIESARETLASATGADTTQIIFNSGATEGNNTVLKHFDGQRILASSIEHAATLQAGPKLKEIPVTEEGVLDLNALEKLLKERPTALVSVMLINNETGIIQPIKEASDLAHKHGALFHCDGVQALGRIEIDINALGIDFLTLSSHKIGGPQGVGALAMRLCGQTPILITGGGQEKSARAGTENVAGIAGFAAATKAAINNLDSYQSQTKALQDTLENALQNVKIYGQNASRATNTTLFSVPGTTSERLLMALDLEGIAVSNGSACSSGRVEPSHVLKAMGENDKEASSALRISTGWDTTHEDIERFLNAFEKIMARIERKQNA